ncbi:hypothetical protein ACVWZ6_000187 [Bradyrhizobium sp. GM6.1]
MLRLFVVIELPFDALDGTMEQVDGRPEQIVKVRLKPGVAQGRDQGVEDIGDGAANHLALWEWSWIGLVVEGVIAEELEFGDDLVGRRRVVQRFDVVMVGHGKRSFAGSAATIAAFVAIL